MKKCDSGKTKFLVFVISTAITAVAVLLYFLDTSLEWNAYKILSCVVINLWIFFLLPALRNSYLQNEHKTPVEWFKMGMSFGASGILYPALFAPYYGVKYYLSF